jgi:hypothetical protein
VVNADEGIAFGGLFIATNLTPRVDAFAAAAKAVIMPAAPVLAQHLHLIPS